MLKTLAVKRTAAIMTTPTTIMKAVAMITDTSMTPNAILGTRIMKVAATIRPMSISTTMTVDTATIMTINTTMITPATITATASLLKAAGLDALQPSWF